MEHLSKLLKSQALAFGYIGLCLILAASYILQGSFRFDADIARDFLLFDEIVTKKLVLIGPRASGIPGVFHGPLWIYLNFPAYLIGNGNPITVAIFWFFLAVLFLIASYVLTAKVTSTRTALIFSCLLAGMLIPWVSQMLNPFGALAMMPVIVFMVMKYLRTKKILYLVGAILSLGVSIQFQMAIGAPITLLVVAWLLPFMRQHKLLHHLLALPLILIPLTTFFLFDLRHDFGQMRSVLNFVLDKTNAPDISLVARLLQRGVLLVSSGIYLFPPGWLNLLNAAVFVAFVLQLKNKLFKLTKKDTQLFNFLFYLYVGYYLISLLFNGYLLIHYWWPLVTLPFLMFALLISYAPKKFLIIALGIVFLSQLVNGVQFALSTRQLVGQVEDDWQFQKNIAETVLSGDEQELGYFIFTPDVFAYESKAAMTYGIQQHPEKSVARYEKRPVTYLIIAPDPSFRPDVTSAYWKQEKVRLVATPSAVISLPDGYVVEKYNLTPDQTAIEPDPTINDWLHFR